jgi:uncharacterized membrane protein YqjE
VVNDDAAMGKQSSPGHANGLFGSLRRLLGTFAEILHIRVEIISTELEEGGWRVRQLILYDLMSLLFLGLGLLMLTLFVIEAFSEVYLLYILGGFAILYMGIGAVIALSVRHRIKTQPRMFATTLSELGKDRDSLRSGL